MELTHAISRLDTLALSRECRVSRHMWVCPVFLPPTAIYLLVSHSAPESSIVAFRRVHTTCLSRGRVLVPASDTGVVPSTGDLCVMYVVVRT